MKVERNSMVRMILGIAAGVVLGFVIGVGRRGEPGDWTMIQKGPGLIWEMNRLNGEMRVAGEETGWRFVKLETVKSLKP